MVPIYFDNASTTQVSKDVFDAMKPFFVEEFGNPSSLHEKGIKNRKLVNQSRKKIAELLHCSHKEIHFTSCGTESTNWALKGLAFANNTKGEIITTKIEHHATSHTVEFLERLGYIVHYVPVDTQGFVDLEALKSLINDNTLVVSIILANNEIGTIQHANAISKICEEGSCYLHFDAVQAITHTPILLDQCTCDLMSFSGHKFHGPKGIGLLYIKDGTPIENLLHGGQQEHGLRSGTENVPFIIGITKALEIGLQDMDAYRDRLNQYASEFLAILDSNHIDYILNGAPIGDSRLPGNLNLSFHNIDGQNLLFYLNKAGIYVSAGSACDSESIEPSHVLKTIHTNPDYINATIRFSMGTNTTYDEMKYVANELVRIIKQESV